MQSGSIEQIKQKIEKRDMSDNVSGFVAFGFWFAKRDAVNTWKQPRGNKNVIKVRKLYGAICIVGAIGGEYFSLGSSTRSQR